MKRSELYSKVWSLPVSRLAKELGLSDVGLAKMCRRHAIPLPPRGYWARIQAGKKPPQVPLPTPERDPSIDLASKPVAALKRGPATAREEPVRSSNETKKVHTNVMPRALKGNHPLIRDTAEYASKIPKLIDQWNRHAGSTRLRNLECPPSPTHGRYSFVHRGLLDITASLHNIDWILRFHEAIFSALVAAGMTIQGSLDEQPRRRRMEGHLAGERVFFAFAEGYRRIRVDADELARRRKERSWASEWDYCPSEKLTFRISGTEYGTAKEWVGHSRKLEGSLTDIVQGCLALVARQPELRAERQRAEEVRRREAEIAAAARRRREARANQVDAALALASYCEQVQSVERFLHLVEEWLPRMEEPYKERAKVWLAVVRAELATRQPVDRFIRDCLSADPWQRWPPDWWPFTVLCGDDSAGCNGLDAEKIS